MPIREENRARYPADWPAISKRIRERAGQKCEQCGAPNGEHIWRFTSEDYGGMPVYMMPDGDINCALTGKALDWRDPFVIHEVAGDTARKVKVILTVAHIDHTPENCADDNLRAWCQRCHNAYDAPMRRSGIKTRAKAGKAVADMFAVGSGT